MDARPVSTPPESPSPPVPKSASPPVPQSARPIVPSRYSAVSRVLTRVLVLNLLVAVAKIVFGYATGAISILSDGFHSLTDTASNVVGLVGVRAARQPPDADHPYGHRKYETVAAASVSAFLILGGIEVRRNALNRLMDTAPTHQITPLSFGVMIATVVINSAVVKYESREGES